MEFEIAFVARNPPKESVPVFDRCESPSFQLEALDLRSRIFKLASQNAPSILPLETEANAGIEPTITSS